MATKSKKFLNNLDLKIDFRRALLLLKRKRYQETLMDRISKQLEQVQRLVNEIEAAQLNKEVFERLRQGNEALQVLNEVNQKIIYFFKNYFF